MDSSGIYTAKDVLADINYFPATGKAIETSSWKPRYLGVGDEYTREMTIHNVRGIEWKFNLDKNGFRFVKLPEKHRNIDNDEAIKEEYYPELEKLIKEM